MLVNLITLFEYQKYVLQCIFKGQLKKNRLQKPQVARGLDYYYLCYQLFHTSLPQSAKKAFLFF
jgi:hypothetical protein